ncbi:uncharacterized protein isoform X3 [Choristoneura fumiferana]|uniref:uncharacterized protein isoform X3 n=1 Tax=Choristoneura fumiferana TaxID=7141 RepID=UPI003D15510D
MMYKQVFGILVVISSCFAFTYADQSVDGNENTCGEVGDCLTVDTDCKAQCGCDKTIPTFYDNGTQKCVINIKLLILSLNEKYNTEDYDTSLEDDMVNFKLKLTKYFKGLSLRLSCLSHVLVFAYLLPVFIAVESITQITYLRKV